jgi:serine/threonine protein kinase
LLLDKDGNIKILDMGLARVTENDDAAAGATMAERLTRTGQMLGTVDYVSPEQAADTRSADHRSDVYSLGCTLFSLLTGKPVYSGDTAMTKLIAHCEAKIPSLPDALPGAPAKLDRVFAKMLAKRPEDRYQSMTEVIGALEACLVPDSPAEQAAGASTEPAEAAPGRDGGSAAPAPEPAKQPACKLTTKAAALKTVTIEDSVGSEDGLTRTEREQPTVDGYQATVRDRPIAIGVERLPPGGGRVNTTWLLVVVGVAVLVGAIGLAYWLFL